MTRTKSGERSPETPVYQKVVDFSTTFRLSGRRSRVHPDASVRSPLPLPDGNAGLDLLYPGAAGREDLVPVGGGGDDDDRHLSDPEPPDAVPLGPGDPIQRLADVLHENEDVVAVGGRLEHPSGEVQESAAAELTLWRVFCEQFMLEKLGIGGYWRSRALFRESPDEPSEAAQVMGACLMFRPIERMDERFFLYCEDTDLCLRLRRHGRIFYVPGARFRHELGASSVGRRWLSVARYNRGKELYFRIHRGRASAALCWLFDRGGALFRLAMWGAATLATLGLVPKFRRQTTLFFRVATAPAKGPPSPRDSR